jgi:serine/threonine protein kinase
LSTHLDFIGPYQLLRMIRSGQTCSVWEARSSYDQERVAVKVLLKRHEKNRTQIAHLRHEAEVGKSLDHPNVIKIYEFVDKFALPFIVMQLFNARNLKQELRERRDHLLFNIRDIIERGATGLRHVHEKGWVHCDVKPDNFLVDDSANVKLIDFSIAKEMKKKAGLLSRLGRRGRSVQGTRSYMSPEQIRGQSLDARSDIYSFGCVCFEALTGRPPFTATSPDEVLAKHLRSAPPSLQALEQRVTPEFTGLVEQCLAKKPDNRPKSFDDFLDQFSSIQIFRAGMRPKIESVEEKRTR